MQGKISRNTLCPGGVNPLFFGSFLGFFLGFQDSERKKRMLVNLILSIYRQILTIMRPVHQSFFLDFLAKCLFLIWLVGQEVGDIHGRMNTVLYS
jgi:hypothetical protein